MKMSLFLLTPLVLLAGLAAAAPPKKTVKPPVKPKPPTSVGVKGAAQMAGGALRFGEIFALKSGFTYQILSARYSLDPFVQDSVSADEKFLVLRVAIKNNRKEGDTWFNPDAHAFQAVDSANQNREGNAYALGSKPDEPLSPSLKPGQGLGQGGGDPLEVAVKVPMTARLAKLILKQGREGASEEVLRFFLAGATEAEAGGKPDPTNVIAPLPAWAEAGATIPVGQAVPTKSYFMTLTGFSSAGSPSGQEPEEGKKWVFANVNVKNAFKSVKQGVFNFYGGDSINNLVLIDSDGEKYPASRFFKAKKDEEPDSDLDPGEERAFRIGFLVPKDAAFKSAKLGSPPGHVFLFDASAAGK